MLLQYVMLYRGIVWEYLDIRVESSTTKMNKEPDE